MYLSHIHAYVYTYTQITLNPNPLMHINIMFTWINELVTNLSPTGFKVHLRISTSLLIHILLHR
jgi:hypothetical protein